MSNPNESLVPMRATTTQKIVKLSHDNVDCAGGFSILMEPGRVHIYPPNEGGNHLTIPRKAFDDIVMWYARGLIPKSDKRKREQP